MRRRILLGTGAALAASTALLPMDARAHGEGGVALTAVVQSVSPAVPGLSVEALRSVAPLLEVRNRTAAEVVVLGEAGEPFLRLGSRRIFGNRRSPTLRRSADPFARPQRAETAPATAAPDWRRLGGGTSWRFFDPRLRIEPAGSRTRAPFSVPLWVGARRVLVRGFVQAGEIGHLRSVPDRMPDVRGLKLRLVPGSIPALFVRNETGQVLEIPGSEAEPFLRIGPGGVHANRRSPSFYRAGRQAIRPVPPSAHAGATPAWTRLSTEPAWAWLEHRARVPARGLRPFALGSRTGTVGRWTTPLRLGGRDLAITGRLVWVPARVAPAANGSSSPAWPVPSAAAALLALVGAVRLRRARLGAVATPDAGDRTVPPR